MKANKTHISLETAKLLKDCRMESELYFAENEGFVVEKHKIDKSQDWKDGYFYPAYTWQEILWENAEKFFGKKYIYCGGYSWSACKEYPKDILDLLQQKKYKEADKYFRDNCILIK